MAVCERIWSNNEIAMFGFCTMIKQVFWCRKLFQIMNLQNKPTFRINIQSSVDARTKYEGGW